MSIIRKKASALGKGRVDRPRLEATTDAQAQADKDEDGYGHFEFGPDTRVVPRVDVRKIRESIGLTQDEFALRFRLSLRTVQEWEQGRKQPTEAARVLLFAISREPKALARALRPGKAI